MAKKGRAPSSAITLNGAHETEATTNHDTTPTWGGQPGDDRSTVKALTKLVQSTVGLDENQATTVVYWAIATYGLPQLDTFPILAVYGSTSTGNSTTMRILHLLVGKPSPPDKPLNASKATMAVLRDNLKPDMTVFLEEADSVDESLLQNRYSRHTALSEVNRQQFGPKGGNKGWKREPIDTFGATVLHCRKPFKDAATLARSIVISTRYKGEGVAPFRPENFVAYAPQLKAIAAKVDWEGLQESGGNRVADTWAPLLAVDNHIGGEWAPYAQEQMDKARVNLKLGQEEEPSQAVYLALLSLALGSDDSGNVQPKDRVLLSEVVMSMPIDLPLSSWPAGQLLRGLGFKTGKAGGKQYVYTGGTAKLLEVGQALEIQDEWLKQAASAAA